VVEARSLPARFAMAAFAARTLLSRVHVVLSMARQTIGLHLLLKCGVGMTVFALHLGMPSAQRITRFPGVVETRPFPLRFQVTGLAACAKSTAMHIIAGVTPITRRRRLFLIPRIRMAGVALDTFVGLTQFEFRISIMIEDRFLPTRFRMAVLAVRAQPAFVNVVLAVASNTSGR